MIDEKLTYKKFGYYSTDLSPKSHKRIIAVCDKCGKIREPKKQSYRNLCKPCSKQGKLSGRYKHGKYCKNKIKYCVDCNKIISQNAKRCRSCAMKEFLKDPRNNGMFGKPSPHGKGAYYKQSWMRSSWEIKYAQYCIKNHIKYRYEPKRFNLGNSTYCPDFYLPELDKYIEIKGWFTPIAKKKFKKFKKLYPKIQIELLNEYTLKKDKII